MTLAEFEILATDRAASLFDADEAQNRGRLAAAFGSARIAVIGAAGSIGGSTVRHLLQYRPAALALLDLNENGLAELMRDLRSERELQLPPDLTALPVGLGSLECARFFRESPPFDFVFNFCALKHVRSEKSVYSIMRMIDTNVLFPAELLEDDTIRIGNFFSVSSDKAANPASLLGASKRAMELALAASGKPQTSARFANVAFSAGSLPHGWLQRIEKRQPLAAPTGIRRYFISHREAAQICVLACALGRPGEIFFPKLDAAEHAKTFPEIAAALLAQLGFRAEECASAEEARERFAELYPQKRWPCYFGAAATSGEKPFEEFYGADEQIDGGRFARIGIITNASAAADPVVVRTLLDRARALRSQSGTAKADYVAALSRLIPGFAHRETGRNLDEMM